MVINLSEISMPLLIIALLIISFTLLMSIRGIKNQSFLSKDASTILTTIGIFFTFVGISIALFHFDTSNVLESIPKLLGGLKLAFVSSVAGLAASLIFKIYKSRLQVPSEYKDDVGIEDIHQLLEKINDSVITGNQNIKEALTGEGDASLSTQFSKLRNDFRDFSEKVTEDGSQKLIEALQEVISDFNVKISEQFGENFKQLNEAVGALLVWQKEHKEHVEKLTNAYEKTVESIDKINHSFIEIESSTSRIPDSFISMENAFDTTDRRMIEIHEGLGTLAEMRVKAQESLPFIHKQIQSMTDNLEVSVNNQIENIQKNIEELTGQKRRFIEFIEKVNIDVHDSHEQIHSKIQESVKGFSTQTHALFEENIENQKNSMNKINENHEQIHLKIQESVKGFSTQTHALFEENIENQKNSINTINENHEQIHLKIKESVEGFTTESRELFKKNIENQEQHVNKQTEKLQGLIDSLNLTADEILKQAQEASKAIESAISQTSKEFEVMTDSFKKTQVQFNENINENITSSINNTQDSLNSAITEVNNKMNEQMSNALQMLGNNLVSISDGLANSYEESTKQINQALKQTKNLNDN